MDYTKILEQKISYINIKNLYSLEGGGKALEFIVWIDTNNMNFEAYNFILALEEAKEVLKLIFKKKVPSNYFIFELQDKEVLAKVGEGNTKVINTKTGCGVLHLEFKVEHNSFNNIIYNMIGQGVLVRIDDKGTLVPLRSLVFNKNNLNMSLLYYVKDYGFVIKPLHNIFARNIIAVSGQPLDLPMALPSVADGLVYTTSVNLEAAPLAKYSLYVEGNKIEVDAPLASMDLETIIKTADDFFYLKAIKQVLGALDSFISEYKEDYKQRDSNDKAKETSEYICEISPTYTIPTQKSFVKFMQGMDFNFKDNFEILEINSKKVFHRKMHNAVMKVLKQIRDLENPELSIKIKVLLSEYSDLEAQAGVKLHALKSSLCRDSFYSVYFRPEKNGGVQKSLIFDSAVKIFIY